MNEDRRLFCLENVVFGNLACVRLIRVAELTENAVHAFGAVCGVEYERGILGTA